MSPLRGITWDHPRGYAALESLAAEPRKLGEPCVSWDRQPLEGFESAPVAELAVDYDLLIVDHPGLGAAVEARSLVPADGLFDLGLLERWQRSTVGQSFASYAWMGRQWALPIDAAGQVGVLGPDLVDVAPPVSWPRVVDLVSSEPATLCLGGPHAFLTLAAMCVALGWPPREDARDFLDPVAAGEAWSLLSDLLTVTDPIVSWQNPIGVLDAMASGGPRYCPLVYGYVTYQHGSRATGLRAVEAPQWVEGRIGSVLGGTGVAVSASSKAPRGAADEAARLLSLPVQRDRYLRCGAQSVLTEVWEDPRVNEETGGFYRDTRRTIESAWVRPRFPGYIAFQGLAAQIVRAGLRERRRARRCIDEINAAYRAARERR